jgi:dephospho-CoA kinase
VEEKRWAVADERKAVEQKKWSEEEKLVKVDKVIEDNTTAYRKLLDEEDKIVTRLEQIKSELAL